jgi:hypothetical protein
MIVGIAGRKRSGKDTAAEALIEDGHARFSFATPIKLMLRAFLVYRKCPEDLIERMLEGDLKEVPSPYLNGKTPRHAMQTLGTEWGRSLISPDIWVDTMIEVANDTDQVVCSDVRFPNEVVRLQTAGGLVVRIHRPNRPVSEFDNHPSETQIDDLEVDIDVANGGTIEDLQDLVRHLVRSSR